MKRLLLFLALGQCLLGFSQEMPNLVVNPSFEEKSKVREMPPCQYTRGDNQFKACMPSWVTFSAQTPDVVVWEEKQTQNCVYPKPHSGNRMIGIIAYLPGQDTNFSTDFHEAVQGVLKTPLVVGETYQIEFFITQANATARDHLKSLYGPKSTVVPVACNNLGVHFVKNKLARFTDMWTYLEQQAVEPHFKIDDIIQTDSAEWLKITGTFKADAAYSYFLLGNFFKDEVTKTNLDPKEVQALQNFPTQYYMEDKRRVAYYCIDDISIRVASEHTPAIQMTSQLESGGTYVFENVNFETNKSDLLPESKIELDALATFLAKNPNLHIEIGGHTDNQGTPADNQILSENRATSVRAYLINQQIDETRLTAKGYGETQPVASNETEEGRLQNRRVVCRVMTTDD